jgi:hypothetical protein
MVDIIHNHQSQCLFKRIIILVVLIMSMLIMQDSTFHPDIAAQIRDDAKAIIIRNTGNSTAVKIHLALVPMNIEFDLPSLAADDSHEYPLATMVNEVKVVTTF